MTRRHLLVAALCLLAQGALAQVSPEVWRIAIIIDDLGYSLAAGKRALNLPGPVSYAVLPATPEGMALAEIAHARGKEVLLHLPLQSVGGELADEPGMLALDMSRLQFAHGFAANLESVPHATGVNSHRGSLLTRHPGHMAWLMEEINSRGNLYFVDSFTTHESVALRLAQETGVAAVKRDVFLDPDHAPGTLEREFARLKKLARARGFAVGIGHPHPETMALLERELPGLADAGFELVSIGDYIALLQQTLLAAPVTGPVE
jgi:polysaccharide deacetylase 2 family uncharacterized protein YibQ